MLLKAQDIPQIVGLDLYGRLAHLVSSLRHGMFLPLHNEDAGGGTSLFEFQSQSHTGEPWLGPDLTDTLETLAHEGHRSVLVASIGFIADHLEIFYDIDIEAKERADALGIELRRTPMLNADPRLAHALHALVAQRVTARTAVPS